MKPRLSSEDTKTLMLEVADRLQQMGYSPDVLGYFASALLFVYGCAIMDASPNEPGIEEKARDSIHRHVQVTFERMIAYAHDPKLRAESQRVLHEDRAEKIAKAKALLDLIENEARKRGIKLP
jgi:hypothetical protein